MDSFRAPEVESINMILVRHVIGAGIDGDPVRRVDSYYRDDVHVFTVDQWEIERGAG